MVLALVVCLILVAVVVPELLADAQSLVQLLAFLIDLARIALA